MLILDRQSIGSGDLGCTDVFPGSPRVNKAYYRRTTCADVMNMCMCAEYVKKAS